MNHHKSNSIVAIALLIIPLLGLGIDIYIPSLPSLVNYFFTTKILVQTTLNIYIFGLGVSQIIAGNIVDAYGRRIPMIISLIIYAFLCICIINIHSISYMIWFRFLQGICAGFAAVSARSIFTDLFSGQEYYKKASYMTIAYSIGPVIAPFIGGYLQHFIGWHANFYFLLFYSLICLILVWRYFPETIIKRHAISVKSILSKYYSMITHIEFVTGIICLSSLYALLMLFNLVGPFIVQVKLNYSPITFGYIALLSGASWFLGMIANRATIHINMNKKISFATNIAIITIAIMAILAHFWFNLFVIIIPIYVLLFCSSIIFSCYFVHNPTHFKEYAATASAVTTGSFSLLSAWIGNTVAHNLSTNSQIPLIYGYIILIAICIIARAITYINKSYNVRHSKT